MAKTGPQNVIPDDNFGLELPTSQIDQPQLDEEVRKARYSKTKEFKEIKQYWEDRRSFFQSYTPGGAEIRFQIPDENVAQQWVLANNMINEIDAFLSRYSDAAKAVKDAQV